MLNLRLKRKFRLRTFNHATEEDLYATIERAVYPLSRILRYRVCLMATSRTRFRPTESTIWPVEQIFHCCLLDEWYLTKSLLTFPKLSRLRSVTGVLDGLDFSDDKLLQVELSLMILQRHRIGTNYLQLPINQPKLVFATNRRDGPVAYHVDGVEMEEPPHQIDQAVLVDLKKRRNGKAHALCSRSVRQKNQ